MRDDVDLLIRCGRVVCPATGRDGPGLVAIRDGRIVKVESSTPPAPQQPRCFVPPSTTVIDEPDAILLPGLIDLHAHPARSGSTFGVDPDRHVLDRGTTTVLSQGDAGANALAAFVKETIEASQARILLAINLSASGEAGPGGCFERLDAIDVRACVAAVTRFRRHIWGIAVNTSRNCCGQTDPREVLRRGLAAAEETGLPLLYGMRCPEDWPLREQLEQLRRGDVVTYCYRRTPHCIVEHDRVLPEVRAARERGILFDVGHGRTSFDFSVAEAALRDGFPPDTISTDLQRGHIGQSPVHDLPLVMSKLRAAGMPEPDLFAALTSRPAQILNLKHEIGTLRPGASADLTLLRWQDQTAPLVDALGQTRPAGRWEPIRTIRAGRVM